MTLRYFDYECPNGHRFEYLTKVSQPEEVKCPACNENGRRVPNSIARYSISGDNSASRTPKGMGKTKERKE